WANVRSSSANGGLDCRNAVTTIQAGLLSSSARLSRHCRDNRTAKSVRALSPRPQAYLRLAIYRDYEQLALGPGVDRFFPTLNDLANVEHDSGKIGRRGDHRMTSTSTPTITFDHPRSAVKTGSPRPSANARQARSASDRPYGWVLG